MADMAARKKKLPPEDQAPKKGGLIPPSVEDVELAEQVLNEVAEDAPTTEGRDRRSLACEVELSPLSLVGSFFHRVENGEMVWGGLIVGEPQAGTYLCEIDSGLEGAARARAQIVMSLDDMEAKDDGYEFRFYDTEDAMRAAFAEYQVTATQEGG